MSNLPTKKMSADDVRELLNSHNIVSSSPEAVLKELGQLIANDELGNEAEALLGKAIAALNLDNHKLLATAVGGDHATFAIEFANGLIVEHNCQTPSEKAVAQLAAASYARTLKFARILAIAVDKGFTDQEMVSYFVVIGKEIDRANRQFITAITTLRQLKSPNLTVNVKTNAAFIAQNQQINAAKTEGGHEIN